MSTVTKVPTPHRSRTTSWASYTPNEDYTVTKVLVDVSENLILGADEKKDTLKHVEHVL